MKNIVFICAILFAVSCGKKNETAAQNTIFNPQNGCTQNTNGQFGQNGTNCVPGQQTSWLLRTKFQDFPSKVRVRINGITVADECATRRGYPGRISRARTGSEVSVFVQNFQAPVNGRVQVEIVKLGRKCFWWSSYYYQGNTRFTVGNVSTSRPAAVEIFLPQ